MPRHDPVPGRPEVPPPEPQKAASPVMRARFWRMIRWIGVVAIVAILLALIWLKSFGDPVTLHMQIATILGVGLTVLVGCGLMALVFLSSRSGHDDAATRGDWNDDRR